MTDNNREITDLRIEVGAIRKDVDDLQDDVNQLASDQRKTNVNFNEFKSAFDGWVQKIAGAVTGVMIAVMWLSGDLVNLIKYLSGLIK